MADNITSQASDTTDAPFLGLALEDEEAYNPYGMPSTPPQAPLPEVPSSPEFNFEDLEWDPAYLLHSDLSPTEDILSFDVRDPLPAEEFTTLLKADPQSEEIPNPDLNLAATAIETPVEFEYDLNEIDPSDANTIEVPWLDFPSVPNVEMAEENVPANLGDEFPHFSDMSVSDTEVHPDEISRILAGPALEGEIPMYQEAPVISQDDDLPHQDPAPVDPVGHNEGIDPTHPVVSPPLAANEPIVAQHPPVEVQPPASAKNPRHHGITRRASCVGKEKVHGNAGKKRAHKNTGKPQINVYKCDLCGVTTEELGHMTNHVKHITGHDINEVTISWVGDGTTQPAKNFISGETYVQRVRRQKQLMDDKKRAIAEKKRKAPEPELEPEGQEPNQPQPPNPPKRRARAANKKKAEPAAEEGVPPAKPKRAPRKRARKPSPAPEPGPAN